MSKHKCNYLSNCCDSEVIYSTEIDFEMEGAFGVCGNCHEYSLFYDEGHTPWDDNLHTSFSFSIRIPKKSTE